MAPWARFDDLIRGTALRCSHPHQVLTADRTEDVNAVLAEVERATSDGNWAFGYIAYEAASGLDASLVTADPVPGGPPLVWFGICDVPTVVPPIVARRRRHDLEWLPDWSDAQYVDAVGVVRDHIAAGETYQCNLTDRLRAVAVEDPKGLYADLALGQRGVYNVYLDLGQHVIASASPELFFEWSRDLLRTRPMKGTAARGSTTENDQVQANALRSSTKEQAENLMIVDLLRNDLSRLARTGSVAVPALFTVEQYPTVWQLTSEVTARTRDGIGLVDVLRALSRAVR